MKVIELIVDDKVSKYELPTDWKEISISQYGKLMKVIDQEYDNSVETIVRTLEALIGIDTKTLIKVPLKYLKEVYLELSTLTSKEPSNYIKKVIEIDNIEYGFIPNFEDLTLGEFADLDNYLQDSWDNLDKIFAVLYRPVIERKGDKYLIEDYTLKDIKDRRKIFSDRLSIDTAFGAMVFFYNIGNKLTESMVSSLEMQNQELKKAISERV